MWYGGGATDTACPKPKGCRFESYPRSQSLAGRRGRRATAPLPRTGLAHRRFTGFFSPQPGTHPVMDNDVRGRAGMMRGGTMADTFEDAEKEARADAAENGLTRLAERLGAGAAASAVFGTPVERDGVTVIPVARLRWGFGGGSGRGRNEKAQDGWGGAGAVPAARSSRGRGASSAATFSGPRLR